MKTTKTTKVGLIFLGVLLVGDVFVTSCLFAADVDTHIAINGVLNCVNVLALLLLALANNKLESQRDDAKKYKDNYFKYFDYQYDRANTKGYYEIKELLNMYWVCKCSDDCVVFIVKVFPYDPADETAKATAKAKAEELLNLITENGTLWQ